MEKTVLIVVLIVVCGMTVTRACIDNKECTSTCSDDYHQQCNTKTSSCFCAQTRSCQNNADCPSGSGVGCPPDQAKCVSGSCFCFR